MSRGDRWIACPRPDPQATLRLFCLPFAGGGALFYRGWQEGLPAGVELCAVRPPGRESRLGEEPLEHMDPLASATATALADRLDRPFAILGHSMGAVLGFEVARRLRQLTGREPVHLFVSGHRDPRIPYPKRPMRDLSPEAFVAELANYNGTPRAVLESEELMQLMLPVMRADFAVCETYSYRDEPPLSCPISVYGGLADPDVSRSDVDGWADHTTGPCVVRMFPGDHFFLQSERAQLLQILSRELSPYVHGA